MLDKCWLNANYGDSKHIFLRIRTMKSVIVYALLKCMCSSFNLLVKFVVDILDSAI